MRPRKATSRSPGPADAGASLGAQLFILDAPLLALAPVVLGMLLGVIAWGRWPATKSLFGRD